MNIGIELAKPTVFGVKVEQVAWALVDKRLVDIDDAGPVGVPRSGDLGYRFRVNIEESLLPVSRMLIFSKAGERTAAATAAPATTAVV